MVNAAAVLAAAAVGAGSIAAMPEAPATDHAILSGDLVTDAAEPDTGPASSTIEQVPRSGLVTSTSEPSPTSSTTLISGGLVTTTPGLTTSLPDNLPVVIGGGTFTWSVGGLGGGIVISGSDSDGDPFSWKSTTCPPGCSQVRPQMTPWCYFRPL